MHGGNFTLVEHSHHILIIIDFMRWLRFFRWCEIICSINNASIIQFEFTLNHRSLDLLEDCAGWTSSCKSGFLVTLWLSLDCSLLFPCDFFNLICNRYSSSKLFFTIRFLNLRLVNLWIVIVLNLIKWFSFIVSSRSRVSSRVFTNFESTVEIFDKIKVFVSWALRLSMGLALS